MNEITDVKDMTFLANPRSASGSLTITIPKEIVEFYGIATTDQLKLSLIGIKRNQEGEEDG